MSSTLNKKSTQKQKRICNNDFSQVVVLFLHRLLFDFSMMTNLQCYAMYTVRSVDDNSNEGVIAEIQTHLANGLPAMQLIGVVGKSLDESRNESEALSLAVGSIFQGKK